MEINMRFITMSLMLACLLVGAGCATRAYRPAEGVRIHSEFVFVQSGFDGPSEALNCFCGTPGQRDQWQTFWSAFGDVDEIFDSAKSDPFISGTTPCVLFDTIEPAWKIARFYENEFAFDGWQWIEHRKIHIFEETNGGGDWLKVYAKNGRQVLIHIVGPWEDDEVRTSCGVFTQRSVLFKFYRCTADEVFGGDHLEKVKAMSR